MNSKSFAVFPMTVRSTFHLRGRHLIPGWNDPNFLNSPPLCRRICQSWFYFCKDFPRDLGITLGHGLTSKCFSWFCFAQTRRGVIGRRALTNISAASATSKTAESSLLQNRRHSFPTRQEMEEVESNQAQ